MDDLISIYIVYTNGETQTRRVRWWVIDRHGVLWYLTLDNVWERTFCARTVTRVK